MTVTYDITTDVGKVRLKIGDTILTIYKFTDEEIEYFITAGGSLNMAAALALEAWATSYATNADSEHIGDYSYAQTITKKMLDLAAKFRANEAGTPAFEWAQIGLTAGSAITEDED